MQKNIGFIVLILILVIQNKDLWETVAYFLQEFFFIFLNENSGD